jgi:hypothetical protein
MDIAMSRRWMSGDPDSEEAAPQALETIRSVERANVAQCVLMGAAMRLHKILLSAVLALSPFATGCAEDIGSGSDNVTDVKHSKVERQSIGNCWLYAHASWIESMNFTATGSEFDTSQSYWTYWHWFEQIVEESPNELETGGSFWTANDIVMNRGLMSEPKFIKEDAASEMSAAQKKALDTINNELKNGRLKSYESRSNRKLVRQVMDEAWGLTSTVKGQLTKVFGADYSKTLKTPGVSTTGTSVIKPSAFKVTYNERKTDPNKATLKATTLDVAIGEWREQSYPSWGGDSSKRSFQIRVQKALHDRVPVVITWDVDFNAMESFDETLKGSFNLTTLKKATRPGRQGGHMTVLEDYEITTQEFGLLKAGVTLDPNSAEDAKKLAAALLPTSTIKFLRIKNSWGAFRDDRASAPGMPGYHDLYLDYLNGPISWCPDQADPKDPARCTGKSNPWRNVALPPGY